MESLQNGVFGFRFRADVEEYVERMNEDARTPGRRASDWTPTIEEARDEAIPADLVVKEPETALDALERCREAWTRVHMQMTLET